MFVKKLKNEYKKNNLKKQKLYQIEKVGLSIN